MPSLLADNSAAAPAVAPDTSTAAGGSAPASVDYVSLLKPDGTITDPGKFFDGETAHLAKRFTSVPALAKSYAGLEKMLSGNKVVVPQADSPDEIREAFYKAIGRPEKPEGYELKRPEKVSEKVWSEESAKEFATFAHQLGLSKTQASQLAEWELTRGSKSLEMQEQAAAQAIEQAREGLKKAWPGELYSQNLRLAQQAAINFGGAEILEDASLVNNPTFVKIMAQIGAKMGEGGAAGARQGGQALGINPQDEINKILGDKNDPYWVGEHPQHASRVEHMMKLFAMKHANAS